MAPGREGPNLLLLLLLLLLLRVLRLPRVPVLHVLPRRIAGVLAHGWWHGGWRCAHSNTQLAENTTFRPREPE